MTKLDLLVVEDQQSDQFFIKRALDKCAEGVDAKFVSSAEEAIAFLADHDNPTLIVTDLEMPGLGGRRLVSMLKSNRKHRRVPIIVLSTSSDEHDINEVYDSYANTYLVKPKDFAGYKDIITSLRGFWFESASLPN